MSQHNRFSQKIHVNLYQTHKENDLVGLSREELDEMFQDRWARRKRSLPILPGINGGYQPTYQEQAGLSMYGKRNDDIIDNFFGQGFIGK